MLVRVVIGALIVVACLVAVVVMVSKESSSSESCDGPRDQFIRDGIAFQTDQSSGATLQDVERCKLLVGLKKPDVYRLFRGPTHQRDRQKNLWRIGVSQSSDGEVQSIFVRFNSQGVVASVEWPS